MVKVICHNYGNDCDFEVQGNIEEGQVLRLENRDGTVTIRINGSPVLKGATGESDGNYSVRVIRSIDDKKPSSIQQNREFKKAAWAEN